MSSGGFWGWLTSVFQGEALQSSAPRHALRATPSSPLVQSRPLTDHEATIDELIGVGKNRRFDAVIDDEEFDDIQVICKRGTDEVLLAKPSRAIYFGDRNLYDQEAKRFDSEEKARILNTSEFHNNLRVFEELRRSCRRGFVIPFVGAGMSKSAGLPDWREYLLGLCDDAGLSKNAIGERLARGEYEGVTNEIVQQLTVNRFERDFERSFQPSETVEGAVTLLPKLFDCSVITTNLDRVLERVYENAGKAFVEKVSGRGRTSEFFRAIPMGERYLLKLHGNVTSAAERVLNQEEYDAAYGNKGDINMSHPLPKLLKRLFSSYTFLILGCSLSADRTIQTFIRVAGEEGPDNLPHHYVVLPCPANTAQRQVIDQRLADAHITPLWYPEGEHEYVEQILELLRD